MRTRCLGGFSVIKGTKLLTSPVKKRIFCPKRTKFGPKLAFLFKAGSFGALLVGWLVVMARGLYLARHLFTLYNVIIQRYLEGDTNDKVMKILTLVWISNIVKNTLSLRSRNIILLALFLRRSGVIKDISCGSYFGVSMVISTLKLYAMALRLYWVSQYTKNISCNPLFKSNCKF